MIEGDPCVHHSVIQVHQNAPQLQESVKQYFELEGLGTTPLTPQCSTCEDTVAPEATIDELKQLEDIRRGLTHDSVNHVWTVKYHWVKDKSSLPNNFPGAFGQLQSLEKRLLRSSKGHAKLHCDQIIDMVDRKAIRKLTASELARYKGKVHYIPHHGVEKDSESTPYRIVLNPSSSFMGHKLNDYWSKGPNVLRSLFGILLRYREERVAIQGDISKMYNSVLLDVEEQHVHRILWRDLDTDRPPDHYICLVVPFGDKPSACIAMTAMHETAKLYHDECPEAAATILKDTYVDDILKSVPDLRQARTLASNIEHMLSKGGFKVKQWIISGYQSDGNTDLPVDISIDPAEDGSALGLRWKPPGDTLYLGVETPLIDPSTVLTRSRVLSVNSKVFDPLGLGAPFLLGGKLIMRQATVSNAKHRSRQRSFWDEPVDDDTRTKCLKHLKEMQRLDTVQFPRCIKPDDATGNPDLVVFCDGSELAFGACVYIQWKLQSGTFSSHLVCAKNRLAPLKVITVPRLELNAAVIACRLRTSIMNEMNFEFSKVHHITDSRIVQGQIHSGSHKSGTFVGNRVSEILKVSSPEEWHWTDTKNNIADLVTRPASVDQLNSRWKHGPEYLQQAYEHWPVDKELQHGESQEIEYGHVNINVSDIDDQTVSICSMINMNKFSKLERLLRVTAIVLNIFEKRSFKQANVFTAETFESARTSWIMYVQSELGDDWEKRFRRLGTRKVNGVIVVGHRIEGFLKENWDNDSLILLPNKSYFAELVVRDAHSENHEGVDATKARVRREYWIPQLSKIARRVRKSCYDCRKRDLRLCAQQMSPLPLERLKPSPPFYHTGLDLFGPIWIKDAVKKRTKMKCYGVIFTCLTTRALHLDIACGYDTENFLLVLRRFVTLRGCPSEVRFDTGSQLTCAGKEWKEFFGNLDHSKISSFGVANGMNWLVNKASDAPWRNGCTERLIRSVKRCLLLTIGASILSFPELQTVYFECANILNERPLGLKDDKHSFFCPNDLILGRSTIKVPSGKFDHDPNPSKRFRFVQSLTQQFWKRWHIHYFDSLIIQQKWHTSTRNLKVGDVVLVADSNSLKGDWKLAEVCEAIPKSDGLVRDVELRYKRQDDTPDYTGSADIKIRRPVQRLVLVVPIEEQ